MRLRDVMASISLTRGVSSALYAPYQTYILSFGNLKQPSIYGLRNPSYNMPKDGQSQNQQQQKLVLFACAAALRLLLTVAFPSLPDFLTDRVEISTPVTSFKRRQSSYICALNTSLTGEQCEKVSSCTIMEYLLMMAACSTR